jgi:putative transposase
MDAKPPFGGPEQVLKYLARYTHRVAISNSRLLELEDDHVTFRYKDMPRAMSPDHDARRGGIHPPVFAPRLAPWVGADSILWFPRQLLPGGEAEAVPPPALARKDRTGISRRSPVN